MPEIHGNTEGIRKTVLDELAALYDVQLEPGQFMPQDLLQSLCGYSASMNREIAVYITRYGEIADVFIGRADSIDLPDLRLRRGERRLSMVRCVHTHPRATGELSDVDVSALLSMRFDAMCAVGVSEDGRPTSVQCAFLDAEREGQVRRTELISARRLPQEDWLCEIERTDAAYRAAAPATQTGRERAVLVGIESEESLDELEELARTAGAETVLRVLQKRPKPDPVFCVGRGKAEELSLRCQAVQADLVIFDEELSGVMQKNLEEILRLKVVDRTALILDIFAARASTREGKLQVEMAQLKYRSQRLLGQGLVLSRLAGGIGTRGPGESKLEVSRRRIRERLTDLERELEQIERQRGLRRQSREKSGVPIVALVATPTRASPRSSTASPARACMWKTNCSPRWTASAAPLNCLTAARRCWWIRWALSESSPTSWSRPSVPPSKKPAWPTCWFWCWAAPTRRWKAAAAPWRRCSTAWAPRRRPASRPSTSATESLRRRRRSPARSTSAHPRAETWRSCSGAWRMSWTLARRRCACWYPSAAMRWSAACTPWAACWSSATATKAWSCACASRPKM